MNIVNLTPHEINLYTKEGKKIISIPTSGKDCRVDTKTSKQDLLNLGDGIEFPVIQSPEYGEVLNLPTSQEKTIYIVSLLVLSRCVGKTDVYAPATGPKDGAVRDLDGRILGVTKLIAAPLKVD